MTKKSSNIKIQIFKLVFASILTAFCIILTRSMQYISIPILPTARVTLGPAIIIFASIYLGPIYGMAVGILSDTIGYFFFDISSFGYLPGITIMYGLLGLVSYFVFKFIKTIRNNQDMQVIFILLFSFLLLILTVNILKTDIVVSGANTIEFTTTLKATVLSGVYTLSIILVVGVFLYQHFYNKKKGKQDTLVMNVAITCTIVEIAIIMLVGSLVKSFFFGMDFSFVLIIQMIVFFINVPMNTILISILVRTSQRLPIQF